MRLFWVAQMSALVIFNDILKYQVSYGCENILSYSSVVLLPSSESCQQIVLIHVIHEKELVLNNVLISSYSLDKLVLRDRDA